MDLLRDWILAKIPLCKLDELRPRFEAAIGTLTHSSNLRREYIKPILRLERQKVCA